MRIAICDDDPREQEQFDKVLQSWDPTRSAEKFSSGASLLEAAKREPRFDIAFLDIYMPGENGIAVARALQEISPETGIAFVTTSTEHAIDAFSLHALHYLVKPVTTQGVVETFRRLKVWMSLGKLEQKLNGSFLRINRGIVVNMDYIVQMDTGTCTLRDGSRLPIAVRQSAAIRAAYDNYVFDRLSRRNAFKGG